MRRLKLILIIVLSTVLVITIAGGIFVLTLNVKSKRIGNVDIEVKNDQDGEIEIGRPIKFKIKPVFLFPASIE